MANECPKLYIMLKAFKYIGILELRISIKAKKLKFANHAPGTNTVLSPESTNRRGRNRKYIFSAQNIFTYFKWGSLRNGVKELVLTQVEEIPTWITIKTRKYTY